MHRPTSILELNEEENPRYFQLFRGGEALMERAHSLNLELLKFKIPTLRVWSAKKRLREQLPGLKKLHEDYANWEIEATNFLLKPEIHRVPTHDEVLFVRHWLDALHDQVDRTTEEVNVTKASYMSRDQQLNTQEARILAIAALLISSLGLFLSALSYFLSPNSISIFF